MTSRILIVEDEFTIALALKSLVDEAGYEVMGPVARVGKALNLINSLKPDLAILDASLGGESSEALANPLRQLGVPFIVISGYSREQLGDWMNDVPLISKPFRDNELLDEIYRYVGKP